MHTGIQRGSLLFAAETVGEQTNLTRVKLGGLVEETCHYQRGRGMRKFGEAESAQMAPRSSSLLFSSFERRRHLTKGDRERGDGDKRGVVFHATTLQTTPPPTLTKKRVARCADRPPPLRLHGSAPPHLPAFPFSRAVFLYSPIDKDPRGGGDPSSR